MKEINLRPHQPILIGRRGENEARAVVFDLTAWLADYGEGTAALLLRRPGDVDPYPGVTEREGNKIRWIVQEADILPGGYGEAQLVWFVGESQVAKTEIYRTLAEESLSGETGEVPEAESGWVEQIIAVGAAAEAAKEAAEDAAIRAEAAANSAPYVGEDGYWYEWDPDINAFVKTDYYAEGKPGITFTPNVSAEGVISWTNDGELANPEARDITGPTGKSAYQYAKEKGFAGTEEEFAIQSADLTAARKAAQDAQAAAELARDKAETAEDNAGASADAAAKSETNAATAAANAKASETNAAESERAAGVSATTATNQAAAAAEAKQDAVNAADAAGASAVEAGASAKDASDSANAAAGSATSAANSAASAEASANGVGEQLSEAKAAAATATSKAADAAASAEAAARSAEEASAAAGGGVTSFNGRNGAVRPAAGDYTAEMVGTYDKATIDQKLEEATPEGYATEQYVDAALLGKQDKLVGTVNQLVGFNADGEAVAVSKDDAVPQIGIGTVTTLAPGSSATAIITGDATAPKLNLGIPKGADGAAGADGAPGKDGEDGKDGVTPVFSIGTVETLPAGSEATASIGGTAEAPTLNLGIPKGDQGDGADIVVDTEVTADSGNPVSGGAVKSYVDSVLGMVLSEMDAMTFGEAE